MATHQSSDITLQRLTGGESYLGFIDEDLVATITLKEPSAKDVCAWYERPGVWKFAQFGVCPSVQGKGVGSRMMDFVEARAQELGAEELALDTSEHAHHLIRMYTKRGYRQVDTADWEVTNYISVILSKALSRG